MEVETGKKKRGSWKPGQSGNPKGRPQGLGEVTKLRESIAAHLPEIIQQLVNKALEGDAQSARLLLERVLPSLKPSEQLITISMPTGGTITAQGAAIVQAVSDGAIAPSQGAALLAGLGSLCRIKEMDELEQRILNLEGIKNGND